MTGKVFVDSNVLIYAHDNFQPHTWLAFRQK